MYNILLGVDKDFMSEMRRTCYSRMKQMSLKERIQYLNHLIQDEVAVNFEDVGFCYWHISDSFALLRDGSSLYSNHRIFNQHIRTGSSQYPYWVVSDATQRLTLEADGHSDFWWSLYFDAVQRNVFSKYDFAEFCAHRAALYVNPRLPHTENNLSFAISNYENLLDRTKEKPEYPFYRIVYLSLVSRFSSIDYSELLSLSTHFLEGLRRKNSGRESILGEWNSFTIPFNSYKQSEVGINSAINALIYSEKQKLAKELYNSALEAGMKKNRYIEDRICK